MTRPTVVYCRVVYKKSDGTTLSSPFNSNIFDVIMPLLAVDISGPQTPSYGCDNPLNYIATSFTSPFAHTPPSFTVSWAAPAGWTQSSISSDGKNVSFIPDAIAGGQVIATIILPCGYQENKSINIGRSSPPPSFSASNPNTFCGTSGNLSINPVCGATSYNYTINGGATFADNGLQTLTTSSTNPTMNFGGSANIMLVASANFPGGSSSVSVPTSFIKGSPSLTGYYTIISDYHSQPTYQYPLGPNNSFFLPANKTAQVDMHITTPAISSVSWSRSGYAFSWSPFNNGLSVTSAFLSAPTAYQSRMATFNYSYSNLCGSASGSFNMSVVTQGWSPFASNKSSKNNAQEVSGKMNRALIAVYPTVASDQLNISLPSGKIYLVSLTSTDGKVMLIKRANSAFSLPVINYARGLYIISIKSENEGKAFTKKIILK